MIELTTENIPDYLRDRGWSEDGPVVVEALAWGVSNAVFRVTTPQRIFVLKQARGRLRTRDLWVSDLDRVWREQDVMEVIGPLLPPGVVPEILFADRANYAFAMSHAPRESRVWKETLLAGEVDPVLGEQTGRILGRIHEATGSQPARVEPFRDTRVFDQLRVDPFYRRIQERRPEVAHRVAPLIDQLLSIKEALCHGDYSPKNVLTHDQGFTLVDYETAHFGDPTMDLGFFLSHLLLKATKHAAKRETFFALTRAFWRGYTEEVRFRPVAELQIRCMGHLGVCLLARIDGTSPVDYLPGEAERSVVRALGKKLLLDRVETWDEVLALSERELRELGV